MILLFSSLNVTKIRLFQSVLENENIACFTRNEQMSIAIGVVPIGDCTPELWLVNDDDELRAQQILGAWQMEDRNLEDWTCPCCGEENEAQFGECWKCETAAPL